MNPDDISWAGQRITKEEVAEMGEKIRQAKIDQAKLRQPQGPDSGMAAIIGKWPGDESEEEITVILNAFAARRDKSSAQAKLDKIFALIEAHRTELYYMRNNSDKNVLEVIMSLRPIPEPIVLAKA